jgi:hypothetical protein
MKVLSKTQVEHYRRDGFLFPLPALTQGEARCALEDLERIESRLGAPLTKNEMKWRGGAYVYSPAVNTLVRHPRILDIVEDVLGPNILVFWSTYFIKDPGTPAFTAWHQDATYFGLDPLEHVTAWVALSDASREAGCMDVVSAQGKPKQYHHSAARLPNSINGAGQVIVEPVDDTGAVAMELKAGEVSLHHTMCLHRSAPNRASHRRVGLGISYIPTHVRPICATRLSALLVRGVDDFRYFDHLSDPAAELSPEGIAAHADTYQRFRENYYEQEKRHDAAFAHRKVAVEARPA